MKMDVILENAFIVDGSGARPYQLRLRRVMVLTNITYPFF